MPDSDRLREALEGYDRFIKPKDRPWQLAAVIDAAGRFLALTETGPVDYCNTHGCTDIADESHRGGDYVGGTLHAWRVDRR